MEGHILSEDDFQRVLSTIMGNSFVETSETCSDGQPSNCDSDLQNSPLEQEIACSRSEIIDLRVQNKILSNIVSELRADNQSLINCIKSRSREVGVQRARGDHMEEEVVKLKLLCSTLQNEVCSLKELLTKMIKKAAATFEGIDELKTPILPSDFKRFDDMFVGAGKEIEKEKSLRQSVEEKLAESERLRVKLESDLDRSTSHIKVLLEKMSAQHFNQKNPETTSIQLQNETKFDYPDSITMNAKHIAPLLVSSNESSNEPIFIRGPPAIDDHQVFSNNNTTNINDRMHIRNVGIKDIRDDDNDINTSEYNSMMNAYDEAEKQKFFMHQSNLYHIQKQKEQQYKTQHPQYHHLLQSVNSTNPNFNSNDSDKWKIQLSPQIHSGKIQPNNQNNSLRRNSNSINNVNASFGIFVDDHNIEDENGDHIQYHQQDSFPHSFETTRVLIQQHQSFDYQSDDYAEDTNYFQHTTPQSDVDDKDYHDFSANHSKHKVIYLKNPQQWKVHPNNILPNSKSTNFSSSTSPSIINISNNNMSHHVNSELGTPNVKVFKEASPDSSSERSDRTQTNAPPAQGQNKVSSVLPIQKYPSINPKPSPSSQLSQKPTTHFLTSDHKPIASYGAGYSLPNATTLLSGSGGKRNLTRIEVEVDSPSAKTRIKAPNHDTAVNKQRSTSQAKITTVIDAPENAKLSSLKDWGDQVSIKDYLAEEGEQMRNRRFQKATKLLLD